MPPAEHAAQVRRTTTAVVTHHPAKCRTVPGPRAGGFAPTRPPPRAGPPATPPCPPSPLETLAHQFLRSVVLLPYIFEIAADALPILTIRQALLKEPPERSRQVEPSLIVRG